MTIRLLLDMTAQAWPDRVALGSHRDGTTYGALAAAADAGSAALRTLGVATVAFVGVNSPVVPELVFAAAGAGLPFAPLNYRLSTSALGDPVNVAEDSPAILLFTSGTTAAPKCAVLRHAHLLSYVLGTVEFGAADETDCAVLSVPPYHIAGMGAVLTNTYSGRRVAYLPDFSPAGWLDLVRTERVSHAMVVPTMLARIVAHLDGAPAETQVRAGDGTVLAAGEAGELWVRGSQVSGEYAGVGSVLDADGWFPTRDRARLDADGYLYLDGRSDDTIIRGGENISPAEVEDVLMDHPAVSETGVVGVPDADWGERMVAFVVLRDGADASADDLRAHVRARLRGSRTPDEVRFRTELPYTYTGKLLRRVLVADEG